MFTLKSLSYSWCHLKWDVKATPEKALLVTILMYHATYTNLYLVVYFLFTVKVTWPPFISTAFKLMELTLFK